MALRTRSFWKDFFERVFWTAAQAGVGVGTVIISDIDHVWAPIIATALAALKGFVASKVGDEDTAATLPEKGHKGHTGV